MLTHLPAATQEALHSGIDVTSAANCWAAVEVTVPKPGEGPANKREAEQAAGDDGAFFTGAYNERHAPAERWFGERGQAAERATLPRSPPRMGRPDPVGDAEVGAMISAIRLVIATGA